MKATLSKRRHPAPSTRHAKRRPVRHARRAHKAHRAAPGVAAAAAASTAEPAPMGGEEIVVFDAVFTGPPDKREEELSDEEILDREERQDLY